MLYFAAYLAAVSILAVILAAHDKSAARKHKWRVREDTLLLVAALGGAVAMLLTMLTIRHKTKHAKFMVCLPVIIALQIAVLALLWSNGVFPFG